MQEIWKDVVGYEGLYKVSNYGNIYSCWKDIIRKPTKNHKGYCKMILRKNNKNKSVFVHRLVATAFIPNPLNKPQINHINGIKTDNRVENLEWCSCLENIHHAHRIGLYDKANCERDYCSKRVVEIKNNIIIAIYKSARQLSRDTKTNINCVYSRIRNKVVKNGCQWLYEEDYIKEKNECCHSF